MKRLRLPQLNEEASMWFESAWLSTWGALTLYFAIVEDDFWQRIVLVGTFGVILFLLFLSIKGLKAKSNRAISARQYDSLAEIVDRLAIRTQEQHITRLYDQKRWGETLLRFARDHATRWPDDFNHIILLEEHQKSIQRDIDHWERMWR